jgi:hypothetical protein
MDLGLADKLIVITGSTSGTHLHKHDEIPVMLNGARLSLGRSYEGILVLSVTGIGKAIALQSAKAGAHVVINGRKQPAIDATIEDIKVRDVCE